MITESMRLQHHILYRAFDQHGLLLYVGITLNFSARIAAHRGTAPWWSDVSSISIEHHPTRESVLAAETTAIAAESPLHNTMGVPGRRTVRPGSGVIVPLRALSSTAIDDSDVDLIRLEALEIDRLKAEMQSLQEARYAAFYRMTCKYGPAETARRVNETLSNVNYFALKGKVVSRRTNTTKSNVEYFALKGEALQ